MEDDFTGLEHEERGRSAVPSAAGKLREEAKVAAIFGSGDFNTQCGSFWKWNLEWVEFKHMSHNP